jgi:hypothetical protein
MIVYRIEEIRGGEQRALNAVWMSRIAAANHIVESYSHLPEFDGAHDWRDVGDGRIQCRVILRAESWLHIFDPEMPENTILEEIVINIVPVSLNNEKPNITKEWPADKIIIPDMP